MMCNAARRYTSAEYFDPKPYLEAAASMEIRQRWLLPVLWI